MRLPYILSLILTLMFTMGTSAQSGDIQLEGTWELDYQRSLGAMAQEARAYHDSLPATVSQQVRAAYQGRKMIFSVDGNFSQSLTDGRTASGTWDLDNDTKELEITIDGQAYLYMVDQDSVKHLRLEQLTADSSQKLYKTLYFNKQ